MAGRNLKKEGGLLVMSALKLWNDRPGALIPRVESRFGWMFDGLPALMQRFFSMAPLIEAPEWQHSWGLTTEEKDKEIVVKAELPGFEPKEVKVELVGDRLTIEAGHKEEAKKDEKNSEQRTYAHVKRAITLPPEIELDKTEATFRNGVLEVKVPRKPEAVGRRIEVKA
jgi:HSP20 family protein